MKVFIAALAHESNSFSPIPTTMQSYRDGMIYRPGEPGAADPADVFIGYSDFVRLSRQKGYDAVPSLAAWAQPSAPTVRKDYEALRDEILSDLKAAMPVGMVLLTLHGAQLAEGNDDCEGDLLERVRKIVGSKVPVSALLDLHCNITDCMLKNATILMACKEYPHTDYPERAPELFALTESAARGTIKPVMAMHPIPMLGMFHTTREPMRGLVDRTTAMEGRDGILSITLGHGFSWSDTPDTCASVTVVTDNDPELAARIARKVAQEFFELRSEVSGRLMGIDEAIATAQSHPKGPVVIADVADNAGGGAPGDSTFILRALLKRGVQNAAVGMLWDPISVAAAAKAGVGAKLTMRLGGRHGPMSGEPLDVLAQVTAVAENPHQRGLDTERPTPLGRSVALRVDGIDIVLNSLRTQVFSPDCFSELGIDPAGKKLLVVKSSQHFHAQFAPLASLILYCDAPGALNSNLAAMPYTRLKRPIYPLDDVTQLP